MKKYSSSLLILAVFIIAASCGSTRQVVLNTMEPSPVTLSKTIKKIGIIDRSGKVDASLGEKKIDRIVAAEERWLNENGTDAAINGLFDELLKDERFEVVKILDNVPGGILEIGSDPNDVEWTSIESLCEANGVDAIFSLAFYETDTKISIKKTKMEQADMMRVQREIKAQELTLETLIENGWRIYDPKYKELIDEIVFNDQIVSKGKGETPTMAYRAIGDRKETMLNRSKTQGANYGQRLLPFENVVSRDYYVKGSEKLVLAAENTSDGNWEVATVLWEQETGNPNPKIKSRAFHNLAVASEREEELNRALALATLAYETHENQLYLEYMSTLQKRIDDQEILLKQLAEINFSD